MSLAMAKATVLPFPSVRRHALIRRQAAYIATLSGQAGDRHLRHQLRIQALAFERKGVSSEHIEREMLALERAIRAALVGTPMHRGDVA
jgi:hypothetical protein